MTSKRKVNRKNSNTDIGTKRNIVESSALRRSLFAQFSPRTPLQQLAVEEVVFHSWRYELATRLDAKRATQVLEEQTPEGDIPKVSQWYGANLESMRAAAKFLSRVKDEFESCKRIRDEWKQDLIRCCGEDFLTTLMNWQPANWDAALLAAHLVRHAKTFRMPLPNIPEEGGPKEIPSPFLQVQMVSKILSQEISHIQALILMTDQRAGAARGGLNGRALRFESEDLESAKHGLQRAIEWFMSLRRHNL